MGSFSFRLNRPGPLTAGRRKQMAMDRLGEPLDRGDVELFGPIFGRQIELGQDGVDPGFAQCLFVGGDQHAAQELAPVREQRADESVKESEIADRFPHAIGSRSMCRMADVTFGRGQNTLGGNSRTNSPRHWL